MVGLVLERLLYLHLMVHNGVQRLAVQRQVVAMLQEFQYLQLLSPVFNLPQ